MATEAKTTGVPERATSASRQRPEGVRCTSNHHQAEECEAARDDDLPSHFENRPFRALRIESRDGTTVRSW